MGSFQDIKASDEPQVELSVQLLMFLIFEYSCSYLTVFLLVTELHFLLFNLSDYHFVFFVGLNTRKEAAVRQK